MGPGSAAHRFALRSIRGTPSSGLRLRSAHQLERIGEKFRIAEIAGLVN